jgi:hypothetical protein
VGSQPRLGAVTMFKLSAIIDSGAIVRVLLLVLSFVRFHSCNTSEVGGCNTTKKSNSALNSSSVVNASHICSFGQLRRRAKSSCGIVRSDHGASHARRPATQTPRFLETGCNPGRQTGRRRCGVGRRPRRCHYRRPRVGLVREAEHQRSPRDSGLGEGCRPERCDLREEANGAVECNAGRFTGLLVMHEFAALRNVEGGEGKRELKDRLRGRVIMWMQNTF